MSLIVRRPGADHGFVGREWASWYVHTICRECGGDFEPGDWVYSFGDFSWCDDCCQADHDAREEGEDNHERRV